MNASIFALNRYFSSCKPLKTGGRTIHSLKNTVQGIMGIHLEKLFVLLHRQLVIIIKYHSYEKNRLFNGRCIRPHVSVGVMYFC